LAMAFAPDVDAIFLDEPTSGLDPMNRVKIWSLITRLARRGKHVLVTSHDMEEVEEYADEVVVINRGRVVARGAPSKLIAEVSSLVRVELVPDDSGARKGLDKLLEELRGFGRVYRLGTTIIVYADECEVPEVMDIISRADIGLDVRLQKCSLRDVFIMKATPWG